MSLMMTSGRKMETNPFPNKFIYMIDLIGVTLLHIWTSVTWHMVSRFYYVTKETKCCWILTNIFLLPLLFISSLLSSPFGGIGMVLWLLSNCFRKPGCVRIIYPEGYKYEMEKTKKLPKNIFSFGTANVCFVSSYMSRVCNLSGGRQRKYELAHNIVDQQHSSKIQKDLPTLLKSPTIISISSTGEFNCKQDYIVVDMDAYKNVMNGFKLTGNTETDDLSSNFEHSILTEFPNLDVLCFQELMGCKKAREFLRNITDVFPYAVFDAADHGFSKNRYIYNCGLVMVSKYPVLSADFKSFSSRSGMHKLISPGVLRVKLNLGLHPNGKRAVGYVFNTHLQSYVDNSDVHCKQLDDLTEYTVEFKEKTLNQKDEVVLFEVVAGDFNLDNSSPVNEKASKHQFFELFKDINRVRPGQDQPWTVGTELRTSMLHYSDEIKSPVGLKNVLLDPQKRSQYIFSADQTGLQSDWEQAPTDSEGNVVITKHSGRRRIDLILVKDEYQQKVISSNPVTQLAGLTDHVSYSLTLDTGITSTKL